MIKMIVLLKRQAHLTREEFSTYWRNTHAPLVKSVPQLTRHMRKYVQNHLMTGSGGKSGGDASSSMGGLALPADAMDFDGVVEVWYDSIEDIQKSTASERYAEIIRPDEMKLIDAGKCVMYLTEEFIVFDDDNRPAAERKAA